MKIKIENKEKNFTDIKIVREVNTIPFLKCLILSDTSPEIEQKIEVNHNDKTIFDGGIFSVYKINSNSFLIECYEGIKLFSKEDINNYKEESISQIIKDVSNLADIKANLEISDFNIDWFPYFNINIITNIINLISIYETRKSKRIYWTLKKDQLKISDSIPANNNFKARILERKGNIIYFDNEKIPDIFDTFEDKPIKKIKVNYEKVGIIC